ncbi:MAG: hypothetical protein V4548_14150 [Bacteroidota bacterium]
MSKEGEDFLWLCKELYFKDIHPLDFEKSDTLEYNKIVELGKQLLLLQGIQNFLGYLQESQYRVYKWAAFLSLEYGKTTSTEILELVGNETIIDHCLQVVNSSEINEMSDERKANGLKWSEKLKHEKNIL